jgi:aconitate hydratase
MKRNFSAALPSMKSTPVSAVKPVAGAGLKERVEAFERGLIVEALRAAGNNRSEAARRLGIGRVTLHDKLHQHVEPSVMVGAGLVAKRAVERGLMTKPWVKTSLAGIEGGDRLSRRGQGSALSRQARLPDRVRLHACIGTGPLPDPISKAIEDHELVVASVLSGNRNFEVDPSSARELSRVAATRGGPRAGQRIDIDLDTRPLGVGQDGKPVFLRDLWPSRRDIEDMIRTRWSGTFRSTYKDVYTGDETWRTLPVPEGDRYA